MRGTRRAGAVAAFVAVLTVLAVVIDRLLPLVGAVLLAGWVLARQYQFTQAATTTAEALTTDVTLTPQRVATGEPTTATLAASLPAPSSLVVTVSVAPPVAATGSTTEERTIRLDGTSDATTAFTAQVATAGAHPFDAPRVTVTDTAGLFTETVTTGEAQTLQVEPRAPRDVHIGRGGEEIAVAYGEHDAGRLGSGLDPAELRQYVAGDDADSIDWKATARLGELHVREFEAETDRRTALLVDHRSSLAVGQPGATAFAYLREVALTFLASARDLDDPLGLYTVGDDGLTGAWAPATGPGHYAELRRAITGLTTTPTAADDPPRRPHGRSPAAARSAASTLTTDDSAFGRTLQPYFAQQDGYLQRIEGDPLFGAARARLPRLRGSLWTVILTDDTNRAEVRETVKLARRGDDNVLVFLAPRVLFEGGGLTDLAAAYDRYVDFEEFRRDLDRLERVEALAVAPGDRLGAMLAARQDRRQAQEVGR